MLLTAFYTLAEVSVSAQTEVRMVGHDNLSNVPNYAIYNKHCNLDIFIASAGRTPIMYYKCREKRTLQFSHILPIIN